MGGVGEENSSASTLVSCQRGLVFLNHNVSLVLGVYGARSEALNRALVDRMRSLLCLSKAS